MRNDPKTEVQSQFLEQSTDLGKLLNPSFPDFPENMAQTYCIQLTSASPGKKGTCKRIRTAEGYQSCNQTVADRLGSLINYIILG
jgi:hypothetical protein